MSDIPPISDIQRQMALQKQERSRKRDIRKSHLGEDSVYSSSNLSMLQESVEKLMSMDEARPEMVELGKQLANNKDFPSSENLDKLAEALLGSLDDLDD